MTPAFADTFLFLAMLIPGSYRHAEAIQWLSNSRRPLVLSEWILTELADGLCQHASQNRYVMLEGRLRNDRRITIVPASADLFSRGSALYARRPDKDWSLTDCISFVVMQDLAIADALTADHHFEQAGFVALLR
jgi:hypothetical protein